MRLALSTNWNNWRLDDGAAIADEAVALGFDALELGFNTSPGQIAGFKSRLDGMPVDSVHSYCPVPLGAPCGHPELHLLASLDEDERAMASLFMRKTLDCAMEMGARAVVAHAGYVDFDGLFSRCGAAALNAALVGKDGRPDATRPAYARKLAKALPRRRKAGARHLDAFKSSIAPLLDAFAAAKVDLCLENLPSLEGFPDADEAEALMAEFDGSPLRLWFDTGHAKVRESHLWEEGADAILSRLGRFVRGVHLNDVKDFSDDHRQPGWGSVDFAALKTLARCDGVLRVFEPKRLVSFDELKKSLEDVRRLWTT